MNPAFPSVEKTADVTSERLRRLCSAPGHEFWPDDLSVLDASLFRHTAIAGHQNITDVYLLGLAVSRQGALATFDRSVSLKAVVGATERNLRLLGCRPAA